MSNRVIVVVSDLDDTKHGELNVLESHQKAVRMVETLLESGFEQDRICIFSGDELAMRIAYRPVVALVSDGGSNGASQVQDEAPSGEAPVAAATSARVSSKAKAEVQAETAAAPYIRNGARFSAQFRQA